MKKRACIFLLNCLLCLGASSQQVLFREEGGKWGLWKGSNWAIPPQYDSIRLRTITLDKAFVQFYQLFRSGKMSLVNTTATRHIENAVEIDRSGFFQHVSGAKALVVLESGTPRYINTTQELVIQYPRLRPGEPGYDPFDVLDTVTRRIHRLLYAENGLYRFYNENLEPLDSAAWINVFIPQNFNRTMNWQPTVELADSFNFRYAANSSFSPWPQIAVPYGKVQYPDKTWRILDMKTWKPAGPFFDSIQTGTLFYCYSGATRFTWDTRRQIWLEPESVYPPPPDLLIAEKKGKWGLRYGNEWVLVPGYDSIRQSKTQWRGKEVRFYELYKKGKFSLANAWGELKWKNITALDTTGLLIYHDKPALLLVQKGTAVYREAFLKIHRGIPPEDPAYGDWRDTVLLLETHVLHSSKASYRLLDEHLDAYESAPYKDVFVPYLHSSSDPFTATEGEMSFADTGTYRYDTVLTGPLWPQSNGEFGRVRLSNGRYRLLDLHTWITAGESFDSWYRFAGLIFLEQQNGRYRILHEKQFRFSEELSKSKEEQPWKTYYKRGNWFQVRDAKGKLGIYRLHDAGVEWLPYQAIRAYQGDLFFRQDKNGSWTLGPLEDSSVLAVPYRFDSLYTEEIAPRIFVFIARANGTYYLVNDTSLLPFASRPVMLNWSLQDYWSGVQPLRVQTNWNLLVDGSKVLTGSGYPNAWTLVPGTRLVFLDGQGKVIQALEHTESFLVPMNIQAFYKDKETYSVNGDWNHFLWNPYAASHRKIMADNPRGEVPGWIAVKIKGKWGVYDLYHGWLAYPQYDSVDWVENGNETAAIEDATQIALRRGDEILYIAP